MADDDEQTGKRRKSLEIGADVVVPAAETTHPGKSVGRRRDSLEALCSPSYIAKETSRPSSRRASLETMRPESKTRLSLELSRDVEQINQELSQLLFSDPKGGSLDTRRSRGPQSFPNPTRASEASTKMSWQTAGGAAGEGDSGGAQTLPWMTAAPNDPSGPLRPQRTSMSDGRRRSLTGRRTSLTQSPSEQMAAAAGGAGPAMPWDLPSGGDACAGGGDKMKTGSFPGGQRRRARMVRVSLQGDPAQQGTSSMDTSQ